LSVGTNIGSAFFTDSGSTDYLGACRVNPGSTLCYFYDSSLAQISASVPFTWASGDVLEMSIRVAL